MYHHFAIVWICQSTTVGVSSEPLSLFQRCRIPAHHALLRVGQQTRLLNCSAAPAQGDARRVLTGEQSFHSKHNHFESLVG